MSERVYLDFNAAAPMLAEARDAMIEEIRRGPANPSSVHAEGRAARARLERARSAVAALAGAQPADVIFTSGGTEANTAALWGLVRRQGGPAGTRVLLSAAEHPSLWLAAEALHRRGAELVEIPVDGDGVLVLDALDRLLAGGTGNDVVCVQLAGSETGVVQPVAAAVAHARRAGAAVHCDAVQAAAKRPLLFAELGVDTVALAAHKLGGAPGAGALLLRPGLELEPLIPGVQERGRRGGTENLPAIAAFGVAASLVPGRFHLWQELGPLRDLLDAEARAIGCTVLGGGVERLPNTTCLGLPAPLRGGAAVAALDLAGFAVSSGTACSSGAERPSRLITAMGQGQTAARSLRVSLGPGVDRDAVVSLVVGLHRLLLVAQGGAR